MSDLEFLFYFPLLLLRFMFGIVIGISVGVMTYFTQHTVYIENKPPTFIKGVVIGCKLVGQEFRTY